MADTLKGFPAPRDKDLLIGYDTADDAAVYKVAPDLAMINTIDFITPPVDDPYWFGQVAAANSISDIYSMGGRPLTALNVVMFPSKTLDTGILREMLKGGNDKVSEAGAVLAGGHSVDDEEPKYGLCVNGVVHPDKILSNSGAQPGDALILTKPIGSGVLFNAVRSGKLPFKDLEKDVLPIVASLNNTALEQALNFDIHACTDVTGFGILGHLMEMANGSSLEFLVDFSQLPFYPHARQMYAKGETTGSNKANREMVKTHRIEIKRSLTNEEQGLIYDPQTSGGLVFSLPGSQAEQLLTAFKANGLDYARIIGEVTNGSTGIVLT
ncbi:MAG: selenide, water dikinase SelD [Desulfobacterales bacterium]|nr:selenide, water dikinase SelD [Desulfobacterales bacterium]